MQHVFSAMVLAVLLCGCAPKKPAKGTAQSQPASGREAEVAIEVGAEKLTVDQVQARLESMRAVLPGVQATASQLGVVAEFELLADEAERRGYGSDPRVVNAVKDALAEADLPNLTATAVPPPEVDADEIALQKAFDAGAKKR